MTNSEIFDEFERLWCCYRTCSEAADRLSSPNSQDDGRMKMAIVGFSYHQKTEEWRQEHWSILKQYLDECERLGDSPKMQKYAALALGALLGLFSSGRLDDAGYRLGYVLLPGFLLSKGAAVEAL